MDTLLAIAKTAGKLLLGRGVRTSYSQGGEDALVVELLREPKGIYVDVGAFHPIQYSNTYALYRRGWQGLCIDPNESFRPLYRVFRPRDLFIGAGVSFSAGSSPYYRFTDAAYNTFSEEEAMKRKQQKYRSM